jgi:hypothetical protein
MNYDLTINEQTNKTKILGFSNDPSWLIDVFFKLMNMYILIKRLRAWMTHVSFDQYLLK